MRRAAIGSYVSRRREMGMDTSWRHAFEVLRSPAMPSILVLGLILLVIFLCWLAVAQALYAGDEMARSSSASDVVPPKSG
jgi:uncharacterized membrane protein